MRQRPRHPPERASLTPEGSWHSATPGARVCPPCPEWGVLHSRSRALHRCRVVNRNGGRATLPNIVGDELLHGMLSCPSAVALGEQSNGALAT
jgi:hypothetical protein